MNWFRQTANPLVQRQVADPFFLGDGVEEEYINRTYQIDKEEIFRIEDLRFIANAEGPNM